MKSVPTSADTTLKSDLLAFPASVAQQVFWYLDLLQPGVTAFNVALRFGLEGRLDAGLLVRAINTIVERHEVLRTHFEEDDGELLQIVTPVQVVDLPVIDISHLAGEAQREEVVRLADVEARRLFDLGTGPLIRAELVKLSESVHNLHVTAHHAVFDGWSITLLVKEIASIYQVLFDGRECPLAPLPVQYGDFSVWQRDRLAAPEIRGQLAYWKRKLAGMTEQELPTDRPRPAVKSWRGDLVSELLPRELTDRLQELAANHRATLYHVFLAAFKVLLHRYTGATDVVVGSPVTGRTLVEMEPLIGVFINSLILRSDLSGNPSFETLLGRVRDTAIEALEHQEIPFELLVRELNPQRDPGRNPLFQVNYTHQQLLVNGCRFGGVELTPIPSLSPGAIFDLHLFTVERREGWRVTCDFPTDLFDRETAVRMLGHFRNLLEHAAARPGDPIGRLGMLGGLETRRIIDEWSGAGNHCVEQGTISGLFEETARRHPARTALDAAGRRWTYRELHAWASTVARRLSDAGVVRGDLVALCADPSPEAVAGLLGILLAGAAYVPIDPGQPPGRIIVLLDECGARHALVTAGAAALDGWDGRVVAFGDAAGPDAGGEFPQVPVSREDAAYLMFTSGSTGRPKAVLVPHRAVVRLVRGCDFISPSPEDVFLQAAPLSFDASTLEIFAPLLNGGCLVVPQGRPGLDEIAAAVRERGVTTMWLTAGLFEVMIDEHADSLRGLRELLVGGDVLPMPQVRKALELLPATRLINGYGPTENTTFTTCHRISGCDLERPSIPIGKPIVGTTVFLLDGSGQPVPAGVPGELHTGGDGLAIGYHNDPELTAARFVRHPEFGRLYQTGDIGRWLPDGSIEFLGRADQQAKVRGFRIEPGEIESVLADHPEVAGAKVAIRGAGASDKRILAWVRRAPGAGLTKRDVEFHLRARLPAFMWPDGIALVDSFPLNANGKVDFAALPDPLNGSPVASGGGGGRPVGETESRLAGIWAMLLEREVTCRDSGFFDLGGNSLGGLRMFSIIRREFGVSLPLATLLESDSLRTLAAAIDAARRVGGGGSAGLSAGDTDSRDAGVLAVVQAEGGLPPICGIHGGDGGVLFYQEFSRLLPLDRPFLAIEAPDLSSSDEIRVPSVEATAEKYVAILRRNQPQGPYLLTGYSFGGVVAYEMARQLVEAGEEVPFLALLDILNPALEVRAYSFAERVSVFWSAHREQPLLGRVRKLAARFCDGVETNLRVKGEVAKASRSEPAEAHSELRRVQLREAHHRAMKAYVPRPYPGALTLFRAAAVNDKFEYPADYGWSGLVDELRIVDVAGSHLTIFDSQHVGGLARKFASKLPGNAARPAPAAGSGNDRP